MGTAGEDYAHSEDRFRQVVEVFAAKTVRDGIDPQIGVIGLSMEEIIQRLAVTQGHHRTLWHQWRMS
jgi:dihydrodipicolinate synthase/N-acetylneuraminate lyase